MKRILLSLSLVGLTALPISAQSKAPQTIRNTPSTLAAIKPTLAEAAKSTVRITQDGKDVALGTIVTSDGYIITKASELKSGKITVRTYDKDEFEAEVINKNENFDIAMLKGKATDLVPAKWSLSKNTPVGNWVASPSVTGEPIAFGVLGVTARNLPGPYGPPRVITTESGYLGIQLAPSDFGATIGEVTAKSAAERAGLRAKDVILAVNDYDISNSEALPNTLAGFKAGDTIRLTIERDGKRMEITATLDKRPAELVPKKGGKDRSDMQNSMGSTLSERRTGFPVVLQHDGVIKPSDCGGPLVDIDGNIIGVNIARAGRTESWAIPTEALIPLLAELMVDKTAKTPAEKVKAARAALKVAEAQKLLADRKLAEARAALEAALEAEKAEKAGPSQTSNPTPSKEGSERGPAPRPIK